jgi:hypothetical protein
MAANSVEVVFSFDTTGSMYSCLTQVRNKIKETVKRLFKDVPNIRIGIIAHGDYCDRKTTYVTKHLDLSDNPAEVTKFVQTVQRTGGGDAPECYELVLNEAQDLSWSKRATKVLVLIGDDVAHEPKSNPKHLDWRKEAKKLGAMGIPVYGVQALNRSHATRFYQEVSQKSGGIHINLDHFSDITDLVLSVSFKQSSDEHVERYEKEVIGEKRYSRSLGRIFDALLRRKASKLFRTADLHAAAPGRYQVLRVDDDVTIRDFVEDHNLSFETGLGFYEFTKPETIQSSKEIVLMDNETGDIYEGEKARELLDLPDDEDIRLKPTDLDQYSIFVQSTSYNRRLIGGTRFLYEIHDWHRGESKGLSPATKGKPISSKKKKTARLKVSGSTTKKMARVASKTSARRTSKVSR